MNIKIEVIVDELSKVFEKEFTDVKLSIEYLEDLEKQIKVEIENAKELQESDDYDLRTCHTV